MTGVGSARMSYVCFDEVMKRFDEPYACGGV